MRKFDEAFRVALREKVEAIESESGVEVVATVMPRAARYWHIYLLCGIIPSILVLTFMMFLEAEFWYVLIYLETLGALIIGAALPWVFPGLLRLFVGKEKLRANAETAARALFQRAGMVETQERIGVLIVYVWFEKLAIVVADTGAEELIPPDEMEVIKRRADDAIASGDPAQAILDHLQSLQPLMRNYISRDINDINELPDELWLH